MDQVAGFRDWLVEGGWQNPYSPHTIRAYTQAVERFLAFMAGQQIEAFERVNSAWVRRYSRHLEARYCKATVKHSLIGLSKLFEYLQDSHQYQGINPVEQAKLEIRRKRGGLSYPKRLPVILHDFERRILFDCLVQEKPINLQKIAMIGFALDSGLRTSELLALSQKAIFSYLKTNSLYVVGKGNKERIVRPLTNYLPQLHEYLHGLPPGALAFPSARTGGVHPQSFLFRTVQQTLHRCGIEKPQSGGHLLRHTAASLMLRHGYTLLQVQKYLGHSNISITNNYLHLVE